MREHNARQDPGADQSFLPVAIGVAVVHRRREHRPGQLDLPGDALLGTAPLDHLEAAEERRGVKCRVAVPVGCTHVRAALEQVLGGGFAVESRMRLEVDVARDGRALGSYLALNDAVIVRNAVTV